MTLPSPTQLGYLLAALEHDTWKDAARTVGVTPSAFSQGIAELERRLGLDLFDRDGKTRPPTAVAHLVADRARRIIAEYDELDRSLDEIRSGTVGDLRIGMIDTAAVWHFGDALARFRRANPAMGLRLTVAPSGRLARMLLDDEIDCMVGVVDPSDELIESTPLVVEPIYVYAPPGAATADPEAWGPWVSFPAESRTRRLIAGALRRSGIPFVVVAESSQPEVLKEMVRLDMGWTALVAIDAEREPHALVRARREPIAERVLSLARRSNRSVSPALHRLIDALAAAAPRVGS